MKIKNKKLILPSLALITLLAIGGVYAYSKNSNKNTGAPSSSDNGEGINFNPPTGEEKKSADSVKEKFNNTPKPTTESDGLKSVKPEITYSGTYQGNVEVSSHVPGIFEKSGKCTLSLKKGGKTVTQSRDAVPNVSEMSCGLIKIPTSKLSSGTWAATITYSSAKANGTSDAVSVEVK